MNLQTGVAIVLLVIVMMQMPVGFLIGKGQAKTTIIHEKCDPPNQTPHVPRSGSNQAWKKLDDGTENWAWSNRHGL